jgi:hypothetical protein
MPLAPEDEKKLTALIAEHVPLPLLRQAIEEHGILRNFDTLIIDEPPSVDSAEKIEPFTREQRSLFVAAEVVRAYCAVDAHQVLAVSLYKSMLYNDAFVFEIVPFTSPSQANSAQQAAIAVRANTLRSRDLRNFLADVEAQICVIVATNDASGVAERELGTGFLVGPNLVLTAYHTLTHHIKNGLAIPRKPGDLCAFFDFYDGDPIKDPDSPGIRARRVEFAPDWLMCSSESFSTDGFLMPNDEAKPANPAINSLDFALIKLAESIGEYTRSSSGGQRRGWIDLTKPLGANRRDDRIIIPQHPNGYPQRIDFGRYSVKYTDLDKSGTRLRYDTETEPGTSGAPCFNQNFQVVGLHNAAYKPGGNASSKAIANQAISLRSILPRTTIGGAAEAPEPAVLPKPSRLWKVNDEQVILHRDSLLDWIGRAARLNPAGGRADRVYAGVGTGPNSGKTFSISILRTARRETGEPVVVIGSRSEAIPTSARDFIFALAGQLSIPTKLLEDFPVRPAIDHPVASTDGDKDDKWASDVVPAWFNGVLRKCRELEVDVSAEAKEQLRAFRKKQWPMPREFEAALEAAANSQQPIFEKRAKWPLAWIALDGLTEGTHYAEVRNLIAGLTGGSFAETSVPEELGRLRWLFLGNAPDFVDPTAITREILNPLDVTEADFIECVRRCASTWNWKLPEEIEGKVFEIINAAFTVPEFKELLDRPEVRFKIFQGYFAKVAPILKRARTV